jgi:tyrosinase
MLKLQPESCLTNCRESLRDSPVFSNITGFGGDGNMEGPESVGDGHGVTDGPFADLILPFYNSDDHDHCLSRAFADGKTRGTLPGDQVRPAVVEEILSQTDYKSFFLQLEKGPHNQIPNGIGGDFLKFTAPNDPLFFLHHGYPSSCSITRTGLIFVVRQLDRLWWMWQRANPEARKRDYGGISRHASKVPASLQDAIPMGELSSAIRVIDMMDTETGMLCYTY